MEQHDLFKNIRNQMEEFYSSSDNSDYYLGQIKEIMKKDADFDLNLFRDQYLKGRIYHRIRFIKVDSFRDYAAILQRNPNERTKLKEILTVHTTDFFRDVTPFRYLEKILIPKMAREKGNTSVPIRILSAPCSTGQEVYSLAIIANYLRKKHIVLNPIEIIGIDVDRGSIEKAKNGIYRLDEIKNITADAIQNNFEYINSNHLRLKAEIRDICHFYIHDMFRPFQITEKFDLILCRNLLIYISRSDQLQIISNLTHNARNGTYFMLGMTEGMSLMNETDFRMESMEEHIYQYLLDDPIDGKKIASPAYRTAKTIPSENPPDPNGIAVYTEPSPNIVYKPPRNQKILDNLAAASQRALNAAQAIQTTQKSVNLSPSSSNHIDSSNKSSSQNLSNRKTDENLQKPPPESEQYGAKTQESPTSLSFEKDSIPTTISQNNLQSTTNSVKNSYDLSKATASTPSSGIKLQKKNFEGATPVQTENSLQKTPDVVEPSRISTSSKKESVSQPETKSIQNKSVVIEKKAELTPGFAPSEKQIKRSISIIDRLSKTQDDEISKYVEIARMTALTGNPVESHPSEKNDIEHPITENKMTEEFDSIASFDGLNDPPEFSRIMDVLKARDSEMSEIVKRAKKTPKQSQLDTAADILSVDDNIDIDDLSLYLFSDDSIQLAKVDSSKKPDSMQNPQKSKVSTESEPSDLKPNIEKKKVIDILKARAQAEDDAITNIVKQAKARKTTVNQKPIITTESDQNMLAEVKEQSNSPERLKNPKKSGPKKTKSSKK
jgi:chemotaxis methyl-accepting protein methylase